jgi:hypothetical protein
VTVADDQPTGETPDELDVDESELPEASRGTARPAIADESAAPDESGSGQGSELGAGGD